MAKAQCKTPGCNCPVKGRGLCERHYRQLLRGRYQVAEPDPNLLPEDGIVDDIAVDAAISGTPRMRGQPLRLTQRERELAGAVILAMGGTEDTLRAHLYLPSGRVARELIEAIKSPQGDTGELRAA